MSRARSCRCRCDIAVPAGCRGLIEAGALVAINSGGGKDSQTMTILLTRIVPREQLLVVHAPLGEVEWPGTIEDVESTMPGTVPLIFAPIALAKRFSNASRSVACGLAARLAGVSAISRPAPSNASSAGISKPIPASRDSASTPK